MKLAIWDNNSGVLILGGLKDHRGNYVNDAQVSAALSRDSVEVWTGPLVYVPDSDGRYEADVSNADVEVGDVLTGSLTATSGTAVLSVGLTVVVKERR